MVNMPTTAELADLILETAPEHKGWSIVESPNASNHYEQLLEWAAEITVRSWRMDSRLRSPQLGLVLLWLESEVARRQGREGSLWPILSNQNIVPWCDLVHRELFNGAGNPTQIHRIILRDAAEHYSLRHSFDSEEGQNWYRLINLQFGFTHDDAVQRLAFWLSGQAPPISVQELLESNDSGSMAFQQVWRSLRMFRLGNLSPEILEARLKSNIWVLPDWCGDLIEAARQSRAQNLEVEDLEAVEVKFFTPPHLVVPENEQPYFTTSLCNLDQLGLSADSYELKAGEQTIALLIRQEDSSYYNAGPEFIKLPTQPTIMLSLVSSDGRIIEHNEAVLWNPIEEVTVYSQKTREMIPPGVRLRTGSGVYLIASSDVSLNPPPSESIDLGLGYGLHRIGQGWTGQLEGLLDEDVIWTTQAQVPVEANVVYGVTAHFTNTLNLYAHDGIHPDPPWSLPIRFHIPPGWQFVRLRWRRGDGRLIELPNLPGHLTLTESDAVKPVVLRVRITNGARFRTDVVRIPVPLIAALKWTQEGKPYRHPPDNKLITAEADQFAWSFNLPARNGELQDPRECSFLEGTLLHERLRTRPSTLPQLAGFGAPLHIVSDPYWENSSIMKVAPCVIDGGVLGSVKWNLEVGGFFINSRFTELGPDHRLTAWKTNMDGDSNVGAIPLEMLEQREGGWFWRPSEQIKLHAIALTFRGAKLGSWFDFRWAQCLAGTLPGSIKETAALLRAWKAPLLHEDHNNSFSQAVAWFSNHWLEILPVWLSTNEMAAPDGENWPMPLSSPGWDAVVREFLFASFPNIDCQTSRELVDALAPGAHGAQAIGSAIWRMVDVCPILAARVAHIYLNEFVMQPERNVFFQRFLLFSELDSTDERAEEIARKHGNRDGIWLKSNVPTFRKIERRGKAAIPYAFRILAKNQDFRLFALGKWLREIR